jgi:hypothetical protein
MKQQYNNTLIMIIGIFILSVIGIFAWYTLKKDENQLIAQNIKYAADKGIDPLAVRCAYAAEGKIDTICVLYITHNKSKDLGDITAPLIRK